MMNHCVTTMNCVADTINRQSEQINSFASLVNKHTTTNKRVATDHHIPFTGIKKKIKKITQYDDGMDGAGGWS